MTVLPTSDAGITPVISPDSGGSGPPLTLCTALPKIVTITAAAGVATDASPCDHQHASPVVWDSEAVDGTSSALNVRANRSANSGTVRSAGAGITQFGSDTSGVAGGAQADYSSILGGDLNGVDLTSGYSAVVSGYTNTLVDCRQSFIGAGSGNRGISATSGAIVAGADNLINIGNYTFIGAGSGNSAVGPASCVVAGTGNTNSGSDATIASGVGNVIDADGASCFIGAGNNGQIRTSARSFIGTGSNQSISSASDSCIVAGRAQQIANNNRCGILAGDGNLVQGANGIVGAGHTNQALAANSGVFCGDSNGANAGSDQSAVLAGSTNAVTGAFNSCIGAGTGNTVTGASSIIGAGTGNSTAAATSGILCGTSGLIEAACTSAVIAGGAGCQVKDDPAPGTKLLARSRLVHNFGANAGIITGSDKSSMLGGDGSIITGAPCSMILGGNDVATLGATASQIVGVGIAADASTYWYGHAIVASEGSLIRGSVGVGNGIYSTNRGRIGTVGSLNATSFCGLYSCDNITTITNAIDCSAFGAENGLIGSEALSGSVYSSIFGGRAGRLGTVGAGVTACVLLGGNGNAVQNAAVNCSITGGATNLITNCTSAHIGGGSSNTITTTATNAVICGGLSNTITTALQASIVGGASCSIASGSTNAHIGGGNTNAIGATAGCTAAFIGAGNNNSVSNASNSSGIVAGSSNQIYGGSAARSFIGAGNTNGVLVPDAAIVSGTSNGISSGGDRGFIGAGTLNSVAGASDGAVVAGQRNAVSGLAAGILCGIGGSATMQTQAVLSGGYTASVGERQKYELVLRGDTAGAAPAEAAILKFGVAGGVPTQEITLVNGKSYAIKAIVNATRAGAANVATSASWEIFATAYCTGGVVTVAANNTVNLPAVLPGGLLGATIAFSGTGTTLRLTATIAGGTTLASKWTADVTVVETLA